MGRFDVTHTADPRVVLDRARSEPWDLVLTDLDLPTMTGLDLLGALRWAVLGLPVAVITADAGPGPDANAARRQADAFLQKPVPAAQLVAVAEGLIGTRLPARHPPAHTRATSCRRHRHHMPSKPGLFALGGIQTF